MQAAQLNEFYDCIQSLVKEENQRLDPSDTEYVHKIHRSSQIYEFIGRSLIQFSMDPLSWSAGVGVLSLHFIQEWNLAHAIVHKTWDEDPNAAKFHYKNARSWSVHMSKRLGMRGHLSHHSHTAVIGRDADFSHHGWDRLSEKVEWKPYHLIQFPLAFVAFPFSLWAQSVHYSGLTDLFSGSEGSKPLVLKGKSKEDLQEAIKNFGEGFLPYFAYNYMLFPALAGPFWWKVAFGNFCSELLCNVWMACVNLGNHLGGDTELLLTGEEPKDRKLYLLKTIRVCNDFPLPKFLDFHTGGLNYHLAHHLSPRLSPNRLKGLTEKIKQTCLDYKVPYNEKGLLKASINSFVKIASFAFPGRKRKLERVEGTVAPPKTCEAKNYLWKVTSP